MANGELELVRKQRAKEEKDRMDEAKRRNQEQQEKIRKRERLNLDIMRQWKLLLFLKESKIMPKC